VILYRIIHHPSGGASFAGASFSYGIKIGIWLGLIAAAAVTYGGYLMMSEEGTSLSDIGHPPNRTVVGATPPITPSSPASSSEPAMPSAPPTPTPPPAAGAQTPPPAPAAYEPPLPPPSPSSSGESAF
jgi:hypothetical protein